SSGGKRFSPVEMLGQSEIETALIEPREERLRGEAQSTLKEGILRIQGSSQPVAKRLHLQIPIAPQANRETCDQCREVAGCENGAIHQVIAVLELQVSGKTLKVELREAAKIYRRGPGSAGGLLQPGGAPKADMAELKNIFELQ